MSSQPIGSDSDFRDAFLEGAAKAFFVTAYADHAEEGDNTDNELTDEEREAREELPRPGPGGDWYDYAPEPPPNAYALAGELWAGLHHLNGCSVYVLADRAVNADADPKGECESKVELTDDFDAEEFGRDLAMQAMGTGVSWFDDHAKFEIKIPHAEISSFSFSESAYRGK